MKIGIIGAKLCEINGLEAKLANACREVISGITFVSGTYCGKEIVLAQCGVGKVFAALCAQTMILRYKPDQILNIGVGGSLSDTLHVGDVAVAGGVVQHDIDTSAVGDPVGMISGLNIVEIEADAAIRERVLRAAEACGLSAESGVIASGDQFVADDALKQKIHTTFRAIACDMEGAAIGQVCYVNRVPFSVIRSISDGGGDNAGLTYDAFILLAAEHSLRLLDEYLHNV